MSAHGTGAVGVGANRGIVQTGPNASAVIVQTTGPAPQALAGLPAAPVGFVGRTDSLREVLTFIDPNGEGGAEVLVSAVAVAGMAGVGKTALALVAAHQAMAEGWFGGGVFFIDMRGYTPDPYERVNAAAAAGQLLRAMGIRDTDLPPTGEEQLGLYRSVLADRAREGLPVLVVADNAADSGQVEPLLPAQPCHRLLVTSRHTLTLLPAHLVDLAVLSGADAVDLLRAAMQVTGRADPRVDAQPDSAAEIARLCGLLPLALRIIAALLRAESDRPLIDAVTELTDAHQRLDALDSGDRDQHGRPLAVRVAFDLSYQHLLADRPEQARLFRLLPLNPGPDICFQAAAVLTGLSEPVVRRQLAELARAHLLTTPVTGRWGMHDLIRLYADHHGHAHADGDDREAALDRLLSFYLRAADAADDHLRALPGQPVPDLFTGRDDAITWLDAERVNLVAAVGLAEASGRHRVAKRLPTCLNVYLAMRFAWADRLSVNATAVTACTHLDDHHGKGLALTSLGNALRRLQRFDEALAAHRDAVTIFRSLGDGYFEAQARGNLGLVLYEVGGFGEAIIALQGAATIFHDLGKHRDEGGMLTNLGLVLHEMRRFDEAITAHQDAITIYCELGDRHGEGMAVGNLGSTLREVRRLDEAIIAHQQALNLARQFGDRHHEGRELNNLGNALSEVRRFEEAITAHQDAAAIFRDLGDRHSEGQALNNLGNALSEVRCFDEAITAFKQAVALFASIGDDHNHNIAQADLREAQRQQTDG
ncbi:tetratricopeptide repeat protein [Nonomuraea sp. NPDC050404]|uniref:tetratricopeptide repeat protein n=1 Tax=Nonomuraea sp. NPDC050404 TaxID=3155783 RepID=UPI00340FE4AB